MAPLRLCIVLDICQGIVIQIPLLVRVDVYSLTHVFPLQDTLTKLLICVFVCACMCAYNAKWY